MRTPTLRTLPGEPIESAKEAARGAALLARDKGMGVLDSDTAHELLRRGQHVAIVARDRGVELLDSDAAHELRRRGRGMVAAARGDLMPESRRTRRPVGLVLFAAGAAAGLAVAIIAKRLSTPLPAAIEGAYDDPAAHFPRKDGVIDLTSVAAEEDITAPPVTDIAKG